MKASGRALRHDVEYAGYRALEAFLTLLPEGLAGRLGAGLGWAAGSVLRIRRGDVDRNLETAFPEADLTWRRRVARRCYAHLGRELSALTSMRHWPPEELHDRVRLVGFEGVIEAVQESRGVVLLTAHLGNWEIAGAGIATLGFPLDVVGKGMANRRMERRLFDLRERAGMRMIEIEDARQDVLRSLRGGRVTALLGDQNAHRHGVFLPFFGRLAATHRGAALFALRSRAPVFVGYAIREPGPKARYTLAARRLQYRVTGDLDRDVRSMLTAYHEDLERSIREAPEQYFWPHRRWKTRPSEEQGSQR